MKIGQPKLSERVNPGVISEDEDSSSKVSVIDKVSGLDI